MAKVRLRLPGTVPTSPVLNGVARAAHLDGAQLRANTEVNTASRGEPGDAGVLTLAEPDDVLQLQWETGIVELVRVGDLQTQFGEATRSENGEWRIPTRRALRDTVRGDSSLPLEAVQHFVVDQLSEKLTEKLSEFVLPPAIRAIEAKFITDPGVYRVQKSGALGDRVSRDELQGTGPYLVLVHGTFSSTANGFKHLFGKEEWEQLYAKYAAQGGVLALEHRTVSEGPAHNARQLVEALPLDARVHLLSHSRGGLVGDLLCRRAWEDDEIARGFAGERYAGVRNELGQLRAALFAPGGARNVVVERFLRVAAPAAGTQLAGARLDQFLNVTLTLLGKLIDAGSGWFDFVKAIAVQIVSARTNAAACPGLEAMMPDSPFVRFLNVAEPLPEGSEEEKLAVVTGDVSGGRWYDILKQVFVDFYFRRRENDFVVDTASMTRGSQRAQAYQYRYQGPNADHFSYFLDRGIRERVVAFLASGKTDGFIQLERGSEDIPSRLFADYKFFTAAGGDEQATTNPKLGTVVVLPGIMGTRLGLLPDPVLWVNLFQMSEGGIQKLLYKAGDAIRPRGLIEAYYGRLQRELRKHYNVKLFGFDWRASIRTSADALQETLKPLVEGKGEPVSLLAHSMGGLVARGLIAWHKPIWDMLTARGGKLIMLGTPNFGSYVPAQAFTKQHPLVQMIRILDKASSLDEVATVIRHFPGLIEMLPRPPGSSADQFGLLSEGNWNQHPGCPDSKLLEKARAVRLELDTIPREEKQHMIYVAGYKPKTPVSVNFTRDQASFEDGGEGDGTVPWSLGLIEGVKTFYTRTDHGDLPRDVKSFGGYLDLLKSGHTTQLGTIPPAGSARTRDQATTFARAPSEAGRFMPSHFPSEEDLVAAAMGSSSLEPVEHSLPLSVSLANAHVHDARYPIVVGHYEGDPITSVEGVLDRWLDGQLRRDHALRIYPGKIGSMRAYRRKGDRERGVIVVGLGQMGGLTRARLTETIREGLLRYAADAFPLGTQSTPLALRVTSLLIGSWGALSVDDSVSAVVSAVRQCNERLRTDPTRPMAFEALELIEIYRDLAIQASHALQRLHDAERGLFVEPLIDTRDTVRRSRPPAHTGYYSRVVIVAEDKLDQQGRRKPPAYLEYSVVTRLARSDQHKRVIQWSHIEKLLVKAPEGDRRAAETIFRYVLPWELQPEAPEAADLVLELDDWSAQVPWELMALQQGDADGLVRQGILRTLRVMQPRRPQPTSSQRALVIGEPDGVLPLLPGAREEAEEVEGQLAKAGYSVRSLWKKPSADDCFQALLEEPYDIVHIAAHGKFDPEHPARSGVVLGGDRLLTAAEFENMPATPSIVFLNCCHLGRIHLKDPGAWSASLAKELIRIGVGVVVVAGWAVSDHAAVTFARTLYAELLDGQVLMSAVRSARRKTRRETNGIDVTWGAYQIYGASGFTLPNREATRRGPTSSGDRLWVSHSEVVDYLVDLCVDARDSAGRDCSAIARELEALHRSLRDLEVSRDGSAEKWLARGDVNAAFGQVYGIIGRYEEAIEYLKRAAMASDAETKAIQQLANFEARRAVELLEQAKKHGKTGPNADPNANALFDSSLDRLSSLIKLGPSAERYALKGGTLRRMARFRESFQERSLLKEAEAAYRTAREMDAYDSYYHALLEQGLRFAEEGNVDHAVVRAQLQKAQAGAPNSTSAAISSVELDLLDTMAQSVNGDPEAPPDLQVVTRYKRRLEDTFELLGSSQKDRDSAIGSLVTQRDIAQHAAAKAWYKALCDAFGEVEPKPATKPSS